MKPVSVVVERCDHLYGRCVGCFAKLNEARRIYGFPHVFTEETKTKIVKRILVERVCETCAVMDEQVQEAVAHCRRFTRIGIQPTFEILYEGEVDRFVPRGGARCPCGAASILNRSSKYRGGYAFEFCIACSRKQRMVEKAAFESRLISKAIKELRAEIKVQLRAVGKPS